MKKINRNVYFYEVDLQKYSKGDGSFVNSKNYINDLKDIFEKIDILPFDKEQLDHSMYQKKNNGTYDLIKIDEISDKYIKGKLINSDDSGLTYYEENGDLKFLKDKIAEPGSVAEISHFIFFLDNKVLAFEYNAKSSHSPSLADYISKKSNMEYYVRFKNLLIKNKRERFNSINRVKSFKFSTSSKFLLSNKAISNGFFKAADAVLDLTNNATDVEQIIKIEIKPRRITKENKQPYYDAEELKKSINEFSFDNPEKYFKLDIVGINELNEQVVVNYTNDILVGKMTIDTESIDSKYFYAGILESYSKIYNKYIK